MRKIEPRNVLWDFQDQLEQQSIYYDRSWLKLTGGQERKIATENYVLAVGVMFEGFVNDLILAYTNRNCSKVIEHLENSLTEALAANPKANRAFAKFGEFKQRSHLTKNDLKEILDPEGRNTSFPDYASIEKRAKQWLAPVHRVAFLELSPQNRAVIDATIAARNNLAHRSKSSLDRLNDAFDAGPLYGTGLKRVQNRIQQAGHYLKTLPDPKVYSTRADILADLLSSAAEDLVVIEN